jgi:hypothetical protein
MLLTGRLRFFRSLLRGGLTFGVGLASLVFSGCVSAPRVEADKVALRSARSIALLRVQEPRAIDVANMGGAAGAFGLVGGIAQGINNSNRTEEFVAALRERNHSFAGPLRAQLVEALQKDGYQVTVTDLHPAVASDKKSDDFSAIRVEEDLILLVWIGHTGYVSHPYSLQYEPWVLVSARLLDARTKRDLYWKSFTVGYDMKIKRVVNLPAAEHHKFKSHSDVMQRIDQAITGLVESHRLAVQAIASDLKR